MRNKKGFTLLELLIASTIIAVISFALVSYMTTVLKAEHKIKKTIDTYNLAQSILTELQAWDYSSTGNDAHNLLALKAYLDANNNDYAKYLKEKSLTDIYKVYEVNQTGGNIYILSVPGGKVRIKVDLNFMQEDINDLDGDGITSELVESNTDQHIMRISVMVAEYEDGYSDDQLSWATALGYKGEKSELPAIDVTVDDLSDNDVDLTNPTAVALSIDYRKNADILNGLNNLDNFSPYDKDGADNDKDGKTDYQNGDILEADSDHIDNNGNGIIDEAFEQDDFKTKYRLQVYSPEPFTLSADGCGVWYKDPKMTDYAPLTGFSPNSEKTVYTLGEFYINQDFPEGIWYIKVIGRTNPDLQSGFYMKRVITFNVDITAPVISEISPSPGSFIASSSVTLAVTATDNFSLDRFYVFEKKMLGTYSTDSTGAQVEDYSWELIKHKSIDPNTAKTFSSMNVGMQIDNVSEGEHYYRVVVKDRAGNVGYAETYVYVAKQPDLNPPKVYPLTPGAGTKAVPFVTNVNNAPITAKIVDSNIVAGVERESGVYIGNGWPKVVYKIYKDGDTLEDFSGGIDFNNPDSQGLTVATSYVSYVKHNINNVVMKLTLPSELSDDDTVFVAVLAKDKAGNIMEEPRMWYFTYSSSTTGTGGPIISGITVQQSSILPHKDVPQGIVPDIAPPYVYNPNWSSSNNDLENRDFYIGWDAYAANGIKKVELHYTDVGNPTSTHVKEITFDPNDYSTTYGFVLDDLDISSPGNFYFYIKAVEYDSTDSNGEGKATFYYLNSAGMPEITDVQPSTDPVANWIPVNVENLKVIVFDMDLKTTDSGDDDAVRNFYKKEYGPIYWRDQDCTVIKDVSPASLTPSILAGYLDKDGNGKFDDYNVAIFFTGSDDNPVALPDDTLKMVYQYMASKYDEFRALDNTDFYSDPNKPKSSYYDMNNIMKFAFIGKRIFSNYNSGLAQKFKNRFIGIVGNSGYDEITSLPYAVSNLNSFWYSDAEYYEVSLFDPVLGELFGKVKKDSSGDALSRDDIANYISKLKIADDGNGLYDGIDDNKTVVPNRFSPYAEFIGDIPSNPAVHSLAIYGGGNDRYAYATKISLNFGSDPDDKNYIAATWMYPGVNKNGKYDFSPDLFYKDDNGYYIKTDVYGRLLYKDDIGSTITREEYDDAWKVPIFSPVWGNDEKIYFLGFGIESISNKADRYATYKAILQFLNY